MEGSRDLEMQTATTTKTTSLAFNNFMLTNAMRSRRRRQVALTMVRMGRMEGKGPGFFRSPIGGTESFTVTLTLTAHSPRTGPHRSPPWTFCKKKGPKQKKAKSTFKSGCWIRLAWSCYGGKKLWHFLNKLN